MDGPPDALRLLHDEVSRAASQLEQHHLDRLQCRRGCSDCCVDGLTVFEVEAAAIRSGYPELLAEGTPHPEGRCAFLDAEGGCRVYDRRPYVCRTQGLPLRWLDEDEAGDPVEYRDICPLNEPGGPPLTELDADTCWTLGPWESRLAVLQQQSGAAGERVALRSLFALV